MAKPTEAQVRKLEKLHKEQLDNLLQAIKFRYIIYKKLGSNSPVYDKYAKFIWNMWQSWYARQLKYEKSGGAQKEGILKDDWLTPAGLKKLQALLDRWSDKTVTTGSMGIIPLIIWAVVAIVGFFTAEEIVDEVNTTTEEQAELMKETDKICTEHNFSKEECQRFMVQQNEAVENPSSGFLGISTGKLLLGGALVFAFMNRDKIFKSKSAQHG